MRRTNAGRAKWREMLSRTLALTVRRRWRRVVDHTLRKQGSFVSWRGTALHLCGFFSSTNLFAGSRRFEDAWDNTRTLGRSRHVCFRRWRRLEYFGCFSYYKFGRKLVALFLIVERYIISTALIFLRFFVLYDDYRSKLCACRVGERRRLTSCSRNSSRVVIVVFGSLKKKKYIQQLLIVGYHTSHSMSPRSITGKWRTFHSLQ